MERAVQAAPVDAVVGTDPQLAAGIHEQRAQRADIAGRMTGHHDMVEAASVRAHAVQALGRGDPDRAVGGLRDRPDLVAYQARRIRRVVAPVAECARGRVVAVEARFQSAGPQITVAIEDQRRDAVVEQRVRIARHMAEYLEAHAIVFGDAALGAEPHGAVRCLHHGVDAAAGQAIARAEAAELRRRQGRVVRGSLGCGDACRRGRHSHRHRRSRRSGRTRGQGNAEQQGQQHAHPPESSDDARPAGQGRA